MGISEFDFQQPRSREDVKNLFERIGFTYKIGKFNAMYNRAKELMNGVAQAAATAAGGDTVSVRAFMQSVQEFHSVE